MVLKNSAERFGLVTRLLHWLPGALIIFLIWLGWYMVGLTYFDKWYNGSLSWHKSLGMIVLGLAAVKIAWQCYSPPPGPLRTLRPWERQASLIMHRLLLAAMVLIPVTGYVVSTSAGKGVDMFGWFEIPAIAQAGESARNLAIKLHFYLAYGTGVLVLGHVLAALKHELLNRDGTLMRMIRG